MGWLALSFLCATSIGQTAPAKSRVTTVVAPTVTATSRNAMFVWFAPKGAMRTTVRMTDIPRAARAKVRVVPLRGDGPPAGTIYLADLRIANARGEFPVTLGLEDEFGPRKKWRGSVSVMKFGARGNDQKTPGAETKVAEVPASVASDSPVGGGRVKSVIMYSTKWCGICKTARRYFEGRGISVIEKDIEAEPGARAEMKAKAEKQGVATRGVPVFDIGGKIVYGFRESRMAQLVQ